MKLKGKVWKFGDDVNTDEIIPAPYLVTTDPKELAKHCMEGIDKDFSNKVNKGDMIVAGKNFGCGSSREHAPVAIKGRGLSCVIARSYARIFYRNATNIGLPILISEDATAQIKEGDELEVDLSSGKIRDITTGKEYTSEPFPEFMQDIISSGGLMNYISSKIRKKSEDNVK